MKRVNIDLPLLDLIAGTRAMLGAGIGLLVADRLSPERRRAVGWTLMLAGILTTVPLVAQVLGSKRHESDGEKITGGRLGAHLREQDEARAKM